MFRDMLVQVNESSRLYHVFIQKAGVRALSVAVGEAQAELFQKVLMSPHKVDFKKAAFHMTGRVVVPMTDAYVRTVGRPRHNWTEELLKRRKTGQRRLV